MVNWICLFTPEISCLEPHTVEPMGVLAFVLRVTVSEHMRGMDLVDHPFPAAQITWQACVPCGVRIFCTDTIAGFKGILAGEYDHLPEQAFYMVGGIEEAVEKAKSL